jgi:hypothetical protein
LAFPGAVEKTQRRELSLVARIDFPFSSVMAGLDPAIHENAELRNQGL